MTADSLLTAPIAVWFNARWKPEMGAIDGHDLRFIASLLAEARPQNVVEIGCASGLSTSVMALLLNQVGPTRITSFDLGTTFYADPTKKVGYLTAELPVLPQITTELVTGRACLAVPEKFQPASVDFCFIDASHQHPWPLIDTLVMLPLLKPGAFMVHHDPIMATSPTQYATGPKVLQLLLPEAVSVSFASRSLGDSPLPLKTRPRADNIFALRRPEDYRALGSRLAQGFLLGWDTAFAAYSSGRVGDGFATRLTKRLQDSYPADVAEAFRIGMKRYNAAKTLDRKPKPKVAAT
jgi:predicted O-methyltransferase YrrM